MGAGVLPVTIHNNQLHFLLGKEKEGRHEWGDFGGGNNEGETRLQTAAREATEETTGFLGSIQQMQSRIQHMSVPINYGTYTSFVIPMKYDTKLPEYFNNNQQFVESRLSNKCMNNTIFEKIEMKWISFSEMKKMHKKKQFRKYYSLVLFNSLFNNKENLTKIYHMLKHNNKSKRFPSSSPSSFRRKTRRRRRS